ncbi:MAG: acetoin utilization protein AcuC [Methanomassiliicoccales archaeon]|nr:MAG: acetoin utilization protein AcuC [Methanomassiliicoccales archaeon]
MKLAFELIKDIGLLDRSNVKLVNPNIVDDEVLLLAHDEDYVSVVKDLGSGIHHFDSFRFGFGLGDNPVFEGMHEASALHTGATLKACDMVLNGEAQHVFSPGGGFHHALRRRASGFCIYNDVVIAVRHLQKEYSLKRIMYADIDAHHADGVQVALCDDPGVLNFSIHESGKFLYPGTGSVDEIGEDKGKGYTFNLPVWPNSHDETFLRIFGGTFPELARKYKPEILITQFGVDMHYDDPLSHINLTTKSYDEAAKTFHEVAHEVCDGKWVCLGGGGYSSKAVSRIWTILFCRMIEANPPIYLSENWKNLFRDLAREDPGEELFDDPTIFQTEDPVVISETKKVLEKAQRLISSFPSAD